MKYKRIKISLKEYPNRLTRTILVNEDTNLVILGCIFCDAFRSEFEHNFLFIKDKTHYSPDVFINEGTNDLIQEVPMKKYALKDLGDKFTFIYDTGENWEFDCKVSDKDEVVNGNKLAYLLDGEGQGIWEDNRSSLEAYLNGEIEPESNEEDEEKGLSLPWNFENSSYGDFDNFDLIEQQDVFDAMLIEDINEYLDNCHEYGLELEVDNLDEYYDEGLVFDPNEDTYNPRLNRTIFEIVNNQIKENSVVSKKYRELRNTYNTQRAKNMIAQVLIEEIYEVLDTNKPSKDFEKKIKKLK